MSGIENHYTGASGERYFAFRSRGFGTVAQQRHAVKFSGYSRPDAVVLDFGCGPGGVLAELPGREKIGVEINEQSAQLARDRGARVVNSLAAVDDHSVDLCISHHALEHLVRPDEALREMLRVLKPGARAVLVVPAESPRERGKDRFRPDDLHKHLFCWNAQTFGNLATAVGFRVEECTVRAAGESHYLLALKGVPPVHRLARRVVAAIRDRYEVFCVATAP
ncbi:class I SAM-dependent methyltransferase [Longimicrobium sp.]|jgi:SAM-dependent methyltransferase|uniref:class I SAM-dependent methyltransferase n=1 Tax=Longimicrobium sp. TaxID=2029185 RepID=UPI002F936479